MRTQDFEAVKDAKKVAEHELSYYRKMMGMTEAERFNKRISDMEKRITKLEEQLKEAQDASRGARADAMTALYIANKHR